MAPTTANSHQSKCVFVEPSLSAFMYKTTPAPKAWGTLQKRGQKDCKSQRSGGLRWDCVTPEVTSVKSHQHDCSNVRWTRRTPTDTPSWMGTSPRGFNPTQRTMGNWGNLGAGEVILPHWLSRVKWSALKTHIQEIYGSNHLYLGMYMHIHACMQK